MIASPDATDSLARSITMEVISVESADNKKPCMLCDWFIHTYTAGVHYRKFSQISDTFY